jgi:hypothetical protein
MAKIKKAAAAIDLSVEDLANLIAESGVSALPPSDGVTGTYSLVDLGSRLWATMQSSLQSERAGWYEKLSPTQQIAVIVTLRDRGFSSQAIANDFQISVFDVTRTWNKHADDLGAQVVGIRLNTIAGNLQIVAERAQHMAVEKGDASAKRNSQPFSSRSASRTAQSTRSRSRTSSTIRRRPRSKGSWSLSESRRDARRK